MRRLSHPLFVLCVSLGLLVACGPAEQEGASPVGGSTARVEQEIGSTPSCAVGERLDSQTTWSATCASCTATAGDGSWTPGAFGRKGTLSQRC